MRCYDVVRKLQDRRDIAWSERANSSGTAGTYLKARTGIGARAQYLKLPRYNGVRFDGSECINEVVASRLMRLFGIEHVDYRLIHALVQVDGVEHEVWLNASKNFRAPGERKMALGTYYELHSQAVESPWAFCERNGWGERIAQMMLVDYLIANRDRHGSNIEVIASRDGTVRLAPIFDSGLSLLAPYGEDKERIAAFDPLSPVMTTNFVGERSLEENVRRVAPVAIARPLDCTDRETLIARLEDAASEVLLDAIWNVIWSRWCWYERLCSK